MVLKCRKLLAELGSLRTSYHFLWPQNGLMSDSDRTDPPLSVGVSVESIGCRLDGLRYRGPFGTKEHPTDMPIIDSGRADPLLSYGIRTESIGRRLDQFVMCPLNEEF